MQEGFGSGAAILRLVPFNGGVLVHLIKHDLVQKASPVQYKAYSWAKATRGTMRRGSPVSGRGWGCPGERPGLRFPLSQGGRGAASTITRIQLTDVIGVYLREESVRGRVRPRLVPPCQGVGQLLTPCPSLPGAGAGPVVQLGRGAEPPGPGTRWRGSWGRSPVPGECRQPMAGRFGPTAPLLRPRALPAPPSISWAISPCPKGVSPQFLQGGWGQGLPARSQPEKSLLCGNRRRRRRRRKVLLLQTGRRRKPGRAAVRGSGSRARTVRQRGRAPRRLCHSGLVEQGRARRRGHCQAAAPALSCHNK